jgi:hypothetical protein
MNVFDVPDTLADKYHGSGYALAATVNGQLIDIVYLRDVLPEFDEDDEPSHAMLSDARLGPSIRHLQALGSVHVGMLSSWQFVEL